MKLIAKTIMALSLIAAPSCLLWKSDYATAAVAPPAPFHKKVSVKNLGMA
jgi:hypothetical protein